MRKIKLHKTILVTIGWIASIGYLVYCRTIIERTGNYSDSLMLLFILLFIAAAIHSFFGFFLVRHLWSEYLKQKDIKKYIEGRIVWNEQDILGCEDQIKELQKKIKEYKIKIKELKKDALD